MSSFPRPVRSMMGRGYIDFERLYVFTMCAAFFVVRTKENVLLQRRYSLHGLGPCRVLSPRLRRQRCRGNADPGIGAVPLVRPRIDPEWGHLAGFAAGF